MRQAFHTGHARQSAPCQSEKLPHDPEGHQLQGQAWKHGASTWKVLLAIAGVAQDLHTVC